MAIERITGTLHGRSGGFVLKRYSRPLSISAPPTTMRACFSAIVLSSIAQLAAAQQKEIPPTATADTLVECASAHTHNIRILQGMNRDVTPLYRQVGYFKLAGEAFSSRDYVEQKYQQARASLTSQMDKALAEPDATRIPSVQKFANDLQAQLEECSRFQRENAAAIRDRLTQTGLLK